MKKRFAMALSMLLAAALLVAPASAHLHPGEEAARPATSPWAETEIARAAELGLIPETITGDFTRPISRQDFLLLAVNYVAEQNNSDWAPFDGLVQLKLAQKDEYGMPASPFKDVDKYHAPRGAIAAYCLKIAQGDDTGALNGGNDISRQEAAAMLNRAYRACGGELPEEAAELTFQDQEEIQEWARADASALAVWGVMKGDEQGNFRPSGRCTVEEAVVMFLRLYENAPVSRSKGNVKQQFTYEQYLDEVRRWSFIGSGEDMASIGLTVEGKIANFVRQDVGGIMHAPTNYYFVFLDGGMREIDFGLCSGAGPGPKFQVTQPRFSEDGKTFYCTVTLEEDARSTVLEDSVVIHEKGDYQVTVDVATGVGTPAKA